MSRLIAFGCSLTQGQALEKDIAYSKLAWPFRLAEKMQLECVNRGENGASAKKIWYNILNFKYEPDDTVVILWTHMDRWCIITKNPCQKSLTKFSKLKLERMLPNFPPEDKLMHMWYENFHDEYDMDLQYYLHVAHANTWLKDRVKNIYNLKASNLSRYAWFNEVEFLKTSIEEIRKQYPKALDNQHPGPEAMEDYARLVYTEILTW